MSSTHFYFHFHFYTVKESDHLNSHPVIQSSTGKHLHQSDDSEAISLDILVRKAWAARLRTSRWARQVLLLLSQTAIFIYHNTRLTALINADNLNGHTMPNSLLQAGDHGPQGIKLVKGQFAVEDDVSGFAVIETTL